METQTPKMVLMHICCGPCAEYPVDLLLKEGMKVHGFWYNPNIHPIEEHTRRREGVAAMAARFGIPVETDDCFDQALWDDTTPHTPGTLCSVCYRTRMRRAAEKTRELGLKAFTTSLLVSPYQQHETIRAIAEEEAAKAGVSFYYRDFRPGFRIGQQMAREDGLYRQKYCGCIHSLTTSKFKEKILREHEALRGLSAPPSGSDSSHR